MTLEKPTQQERLQAVKIPELSSARAKICCARFKIDSSTKPTIYLYDATFLLVKIFNQLFGFGYFLEARIKHPVNNGGLH